MQYKISYKYRSPAYGQRVRFLVLHYTAEGFEASLAALCKDVSSHYLVPDPTERTYPYDYLASFNLVDENNRAWHAGFSAWENRKNLNDQSIGVEIVNLASYSSGKFTFPPYNDDQIDAVIQLARNILARYPMITPTRVVGHSDIAPDRKRDPGPKFPWKKLYKHGVGAWYDDAVKQKYEKQYSQSFPSMEHLQEQLSEYGYAITATGEADEQTGYVVRAFQMHFRPSKYDGVIDVETAAILSALCEKYKTANQ